MTDSRQRPSPYTTDNLLLQLPPPHSCPYPTLSPLSLCNPLRPPRCFVCCKIGPLWSLHAVAGVRPLLSRHKLGLASQCWSLEATQAS